MEKDFVINPYGRTETEWESDITIQLPFSFGIKGPMSLRRTPFGFSAATGSDTWHDRDWETGS